MAQIPTGSKSFLVQYKTINASGCPDWFGFYLVGSGRCGGLRENKEFDFRVKKFAPCVRSIDGQQIGYRRSIAKPPSLSSGGF